MNRRQDAYRALTKLKNHKMQGKAITVSLIVFRQCLFRYQCNIYFYKKIFIYKSILLIKFLYNNEKCFL